MRALFLAQLVSTYGMVAVIVFVQLVHYPLFAQVGADGFARYEALHTQRISWIVVPLMLVEAATALLLLGADVAFADRPPVGVGLRERLAEDSAPDAEAAAGRRVWHLAREEGGRPGPRVRPSSARSAEALAVSEAGAS